MNSILENPVHLQTNTIPQEFVDREEQKAAIKHLLSRTRERNTRNYHLYGHPGQGKTHLTRKLLNEAGDLQTVYIPGITVDTQYKALKRILQALTQEQVSDGLHTSDLQRKLEDRTGAQPLVIVLDDIEFLLLNDGENLLYYLSRIESNGISLVTTSSKFESLPLEERTQSSLHPETITFEPYTAEQVFQILLERAEKALPQQSLHREALTYIASTTSNIKISLHWLSTAAKQAESTVTEDLVKDVKNEAYQNYVDNLLKSFTDHHQTVYKAIQTLTEDQGDGAVYSGRIYKQYRSLTDEIGRKPLSERRISTYLKHLELLQLIEAEYHYGGQNGKTREITLTRTKNNHS